MIGVQKVKIMSEQDNTSNGKPESGKPVARKRRGLWWKIPVVLLVLLLILVLLAPTIASTSPVRSYALSQINQNMPGKLDVADWSLGWFSGTKANGISYTDEKGNKLIDVSAVNTPVTLMQLVAGNLHAGEIVIPEATVDAVVPAVGEQKPRQDQQPQRQAPADTKFDMPDTSATVKIQRLGGRVTFVGKDGKKATITLDKSSTLQAVLPPDGGPAKVDAKLVVVQQGTPGTVTLNANVIGLKPGTTVDYTQLTGQAQVKIELLDLDQVAAIARVQGTDMAMKGLLSGQIDANLARPMEGTAKGELAATNVVTTLGKDQIATKQLRIPIDVAMTGQGDAARLAINQLAVLLDQARVGVTGDMPVGGLKQWVNGDPITQEGTAKVVAEVPDLGAVLNTLRNTVPLQEGVQVQSGRLDVQANATLGRDGLRVQAPIALRDLGAIREGKKIGPLQPLTVDAAATLPNAKAQAGDIRDLALNIASSFLTLNAKGATFYATNARGEGDLARMRDELGSIIDLSMIRGGRFTLNIVNRQPEQGVLESNVDVKLIGVGLDLPAVQASAVTTAPVTRPSVTVAVAPPRRLENANVSISARTVLKDNLLTISEPARVEANGRLLEVPKEQAAKVLLDQAATIILSGSYQTQQKRLQVTGLDVTAGKDQPVAQVSLPQGTTADLTMAGKRGVTGAAKLNVRADLGALQEIAQRYAGTPATQPAADGLKSGMFIGNVAVEITPEGHLKTAVTESELDFDYVIGSTAYRDRVKLNAAADVSADNSNIGASVDVKGRIVNLATKAQLAMATAPDETQGLKTLKLDQLDGKTDFAEVSLVQPVVVSDWPALMAALAGKPMPAGVQVGGELLVKADMAKVMALSGKASPDAYAMAGMVTARPKIGREKQAIVASFDSQVESFRMSQGGRTVVEDPKLTLGGRVSVDPAAKVLDVSKLALTSGSGLADLTTSVRVSDLGTNNRLENGVLDLTPDLAKVWPIIRAMMPPEKQAKVAGLQVSGKRTSHIVFGGSFPTDRPYPEAIKLVTLNGDFAIEKADWTTYGINLSGTIPFTLGNGIVRFTYPGKAAEPLVCNGGTIDLSKASIDLSATDPRLSIDPKTQIATGLQLNSVLLSSLGSYIAPVFGLVSGSVTGTADVVVERCDRLPLGQLMFESTPINDGVAVASVNITNLGVNNSGIGGLLSAVGAASGEPWQLAGDLKNAMVTIEKGRCLQNVVLPINKTIQLPIKGDLRLIDNYYNSLKLALPREVAAPLLSKRAGLNVAPDDLPPTLDLDFAGPVSALKLNTDLTKIVASITQQQLQKRVLGGILGGQKPQDQKPAPAPPSPDQVIGQGRQPATQPAPQQQRKPDAIDAVEGLIDIFGGKKK